MTFEELLEQIAEDYLNPPQMSDGSKNADRNGHTRMSDLQAKYDLSSLKIQKLLVTAGVYAPVKADSSYYAVKYLYEAGKSVDDIMEQLQLSKATVNACIPYERGAKELDRLGVEITDDAARKRKQRSEEEMKKENARDVLAETMDDDALWYAIGEHYKENFITASGQRFAVTLLYRSRTENVGTEGTEPELAISKLPQKQTFYVPKQDVLDVYHEVLEARARGTGEDPFLGEYDEFLRPLFIYLGVIEGDRSSVTTKRNVPEEDRCACCGRKKDALYSVSSFEDLIVLEERFDDATKASLPEEEEEMTGAIGFMGAKEQEYWKKQKEKKLAAARQSKAVKAFAEDGERKLCKVCCQTIYDALLNGVLPPVKRIGGYDDMENEWLSSYILNKCQDARCDYSQATGSVLKASEFDNQSLFLYEALDRRGNKHSFALSAYRVPYQEGDVGFGFDANEVHRLTKTGKVAADNTDTDYEIRHFKMCRNGEEERHTALVGLAELIEKIRESIRAESLSESYRSAINTITINGRNYSIHSLGTIIPVYVECAEKYISMKNREWEGGQYGFLIDGKLFSGDELALMFSCQQGAQIKYYADDRNSQPLRADESLLQIRLSQEDLVNEAIELINMFSTNGEFERKKDQANFRRMFEKYLLEKFRLYHESRLREYGRLAGMEIIKRLELVDGTEECQEKIREILGK